MRTFNDDNGVAWQAALLEASYGNIMLVFSPLQGEEHRKKFMDTPNLAKADQKFLSFSEEDLRAMLRESTLWDPAAGLE
ncbi:hypothetical protein [Candidatus Nitrosacidococcus sp. I8]|uniref:hypothetical protein n=1 Tax=Candidatus Nitrosacidococcus sp. I8 TaxID=2942908 RepID=UPI002225FD4B|nr:hypothetical protein [Candidatus Nitrosacidococcus sp. I8]CAH9019303.1 hypothetical protein NURINAE_01458 [Candidatus Nitrosacidococcus sp. I8]